MHDCSFHVSLVFFFKRSVPDIVIFTLSTEVYLRDLNCTVSIMHTHCPCVLLNSAYDVLPGHSNSCNLSIYDLYLHWSVAIGFPHGLL